jgi:hypothetical protein
MMRNIKNFKRYNEDVYSDLNINKFDIIDSIKDLIDIGFEIKSIIIYL